MKVTPLKQRSRAGQGAQRQHNAQSPNRSSIASLPLSRNGEALKVLLHLEARTRLAQTVAELQFQAVNESRQLLPFQHAFFFKAGRMPQQRYRVEAGSSLPVLDRRAPLIEWLEHVIQACQLSMDDPAPQQLTVEQCSESLRAEWKEFTFSHVLWCPLVLPNKQRLGGLWLAKEQPWSESEVQIAQRLVGTYAYAWNALEHTVPQKRERTRWVRCARWLLPLVLLVVLIWPIRLSALAPVEVVPHMPEVVTAPIEGVIAEILVPPNTLVKAGTSVFRYEDTRFRSEYEVADRTLAVARADYHKTAQAAFFDHEMKAKVALLQAEVALREIERDYALERLHQVDVIASKDGLLLYSEEADWIGRPVTIGERIMDIADPAQTELRIDLPVADALLLKHEAPIDLFFDATPLETLQATLTHASYQAQLLPNDVLAYRLRARMDDEKDGLRIGWQGTAKVYGPTGPLAMLIFRRPLSTLRQFIGW